MSDPCAELDLLLMAYADGEASPEERGRVEAHLAVCERCRGRLADWRALTDHTDRLVSRVNASYQPPPRPVAPGAQPTSHSGRAVAALGIALCLLVAFIVQIAVLRRDATSPLASRPLAFAAATTVAEAARHETPAPATPSPTPAPGISTAAAFAATAPATPTPPTASADAIAFIRAGDLWLHSPVGDRQVTHGSSVTAPRWSPTGLWLLYETTGSPRPRLWLLSATDGDAPEPLPAPADSGLARWSPARDELAVAASDGSLWLVQPHGGAPRALLGVGGQITNLTWSPNGNQLAVERRGVGAAAQSLWRVTTGGTISGLTSDGLGANGGAAAVTFAPDKRGAPVPVLGSWNAAGTALSLWLAPAPLSAPTSPLPMALWSETGGARVVLPAVYPYRDSVSWSPDGRDVAVAATTPGPSGPVDQLTVLPADGSGAPRVVSAPGRTVGDVAWSPDGALIAFASSADPAVRGAPSPRQIWVVAPGGSGRRALSPGPDDGYPQWSAHGDTLLFVHQAADGAELWTVSRQGGDAHEVVAGLVGLRALPQQPFGASGLVSYRGVFSWSGAARGN